MPRLAAALAALLLMATSANAALISRLSGAAYYDDVLDITWLANANLAASNTFGVTGINVNGTMTWAKANEWIAAMNTANHLGKSDWRLPTVGPLDGSTFNYSVSHNGSTDDGYNQSEQGTAYAGSTGSEMAHLFYNTLDNKGLCTPTSIYPSCTTQSGWGLSNTAPFSNLQPLIYWSGTTYAPNPSDAWRFSFSGGFQAAGSKSFSYYAWAVRPGDIAAVPVPGAVWLMGGALGLLGLVRRKILTGTAA